MTSGSRKNASISTNSFKDLKPELLLKIYIPDIRYFVKMIINCPLKVGGDIAKNIDAGRPKKQHLLLILKTVLCNTIAFWDILGRFETFLAIYVQYNKNASIINSKCL